MKVQQWLLNERRRSVTAILEDLEGFACSALLGEHHMGKTSALDLLVEQLQEPMIRFSLAQLEDCSPRRTEGEFYHCLVASARRKTAPESGSGRRHRMLASRRSRRA